MSHAEKVLNEVLAIASELPLDVIIRDAEFFEDGNSKIIWKLTTSRTYTNRKVVTTSEGGEKILKLRRSLIMRAYENYKARKVMAIKQRDSIEG